MFSWSSQKPESPTWYPVFVTFHIQASPIPANPMQIESLLVESQGVEYEDREGWVH